MGCPAEEVCQNVLGAEQSIAQIKGRLAKGDAPFTDKDYADFVSNHKGLRLERTPSGFVMLEDFDIFSGGCVADVSSSGSYTARKKNEELKNSILCLEQTITDRRRPHQLPVGALQPYLPPPPEED